jgi:hypothetical protein
MTKRAAIRAVLTGSDTYTALGMTVQSTSPVLLQCRRLVDAGHDPATPMHVYRGSTLALTVRSIGEAAQLRVGSHGVGFEADPACGASPPVRHPGRAAVGQRARRAA